MSLYALLKNFAEAVIDRSEVNIHAAATALHEHFETKVEAPVVAVVEKVEAEPAVVATEVKAEVAAVTEEVKV